MKKAKEEGILLRHRMRDPKVFRNIFADPRPAQKGTLLGRKRAVGGCGTCHRRIFDRDIQVRGAAAPGTVGRARRARVLRRAPAAGDRHGICCIIGSKEPSMRRLPLLSAAKLLAATFAAGGLVACAMAASDGFSFGDGTPPGGKGDAEPTGAGTSPVGGDVDGVIVVHASRNLPAFRVCFGNKPKLNPLPDSKLMPQSNVVGVEVGGAVHVGALHDRADDVADGGGPKVDSGPALDAAVADSGTVKPDASASSSQLYVFREESLRFRSQLCGDLLKDAALKPGTDYWALDFTAPGLFTSRGVYLLAVEGCVAGSDPSLNADNCGQPFTAGQQNLRARVVSLSAPQNQVGAFYAQTLVLSDPVRAAVRKGQIAGMYFGDLSSDAMERFDGQNKVALDAVQPASPQKFAFPAKQESYDKFGFRGVVGTAKVEQSMARTQELTSPQILPNDFYRLPSNFVVLVLGDPAASAKDPALGLHFLAIPVRDPDSLVADAGGD